MDPREALLQDINLSDSKVSFSKNFIVLLCGGGVPEKKHADDKEPPLKSLRHALVKSFPPYEVFRPEEIPHWHSDGVFKNLMDFESDLASICSPVVIILESEGAIAELGAFSQLAELRKKLVVIVPELYSNANSFINLGILRHIERNHSSAIKSYPWDIKKPDESIPPITEDVVENINDELKGLTKTQNFKIDSQTHIVTLICELVSIFVALKDLEILDFLERLGISVTKEELRRKLFLLEHFNVLQKKKYGDPTYFMYGKESYHKISFHRSSGIAVDQLRIRAECTAYYLSTASERNRVKAIQYSLRGAM